MNSQQTRLYYQQNASARFVVLINICLSAFLTPLSLSATLVAVPAIAQDLKASAVYSSWIPAAFLVSNLIALLPAGRLADIYGRKRVYLIGCVVFVIGSVLAGLATQIETLLVSRVIQGVGAAMFFSTGLAIISTVFRDHGRGAALGWVIASVYIGLTCGPLLGGWITDQFGWHYVFFFQVPFALLGILLTAWQMKGEWCSADVHKLDWTGSLWLSLWILTLFIGITRLPSSLGILMLVVSGGFLLLFLWHSNRTPYPLVRLKLVWQNQVYARSLLAALFLYGGNYGLLFLLGLYLQYNRGLSPTDAGQMLMLQAISMALLAPVFGRLSDRYPPRLLATIGCLVVATGILQLLFMQETTALWMIGMALMTIGLGFGMFSSPNSSAALGAVAEEKMGIASALLNLSRLMGQMLGTAVITLLMSVFIGKAEIQPENYHALYSALHWSLSISLIFALTAAFFSRCKVKQGC